MTLLHNFPTSQIRGVLGKGQLGQIVILNPEQRGVAWSGSRWVAINALGMPASGIFICTFRSVAEACSYCTTAGIVLQRSQFLL